MNTTLAALEEALNENACLVEALLQQQQYDEALQRMDDRLALIARLMQLAGQEPAQRSAAVALAGRLAIQEESMQALAASHHQAIFERLSQVDRANKAGQAYRVNSKEF
ncbi:hypothetical protein [Aeromonas simiae]|uniref:hypothetical protein n=1 Tax=Aeromonas simiae TaxID=218936 RepID=UPI001D00D954|nr:hypothetical protein [Aeromonas simiae]